MTGTGRQVARVWRVLLWSLRRWA